MNQISCDLRTQLRAIFYILYLDNLFINILLVNALRQLDIEIMRIMQVNALELSLSLIQLKHAKESLKWEYLKTVIVDNILYFLWQDNNQILSITTAYNLTDMVIRSRKRPSSTHTSASITWPVFESLSIKDLPILTVINVYNHYMSEVDTANWYHADFTTLQSQNLCYWKPLFHWLLDIVLTNNYLLAKASRRPQIEEFRWYYNYQQFLEALAKALMTYDKAPEHKQILRLHQTYCVYCQKNQNWKSKHQQQWFFGAEITNVGGGSGGGCGNCGGQFRGSRTQWECIKCNIALCKIEDCWCLWHENLN